MSSRGAGAEPGRGRTGRNQKEWKEFVNIIDRRGGTATKGPSPLAGLMRPRDEWVDPRNDPVHLYCTGYCGYTPRGFDPDFFFTEMTQIGEIPADRIVSESAG